MPLHIYHVFFEVALYPQGIRPCGCDGPDWQVKSIDNPNIVKKSTMLLFRLSIILRVTIHEL